MKIKHFVMSVLLALSVSIVGLPLKVPGTSLSISAVSEAQAQRRYRSYRRYYRPRYRPAPRRYYRPRYRPAPRYYRPAPRYGCNYRACSARYRSFWPQNCTYQPYNGPRRRCRL
ncbi:MULTISPECIES: BA14K family protein [Cohaesibacter]|uniref:BA14K family protein n=1 Tax=Cohaesibacter TaxID=655352 RepID=UPI000DEA5E52|nr:MULTISPECIES: BA14K family protein [Cohaesibacter]TLP43125.1 BA14K family protein [Cohaesibacter sp. CAU 1516]